MPTEFSRQPRSLEHLKRFKATEFRSLLLYYGCVVLRDALKKPAYEHFLSLVVAMRILLDENDNFRNTNLDYAEQLLIFFTSNSRTFFGANFVVYNIHSLIHLVDDSRYFGVNLDKISSFPFENFLQILKKFVRNATNPLVSIVKRLEELECSDGEILRKTIFTKFSNINKDSWFILRNGNVISIQKLRTHDLFQCKVYQKRLLNDYFKRPCSSNFVGIYLLEEQIVGEVQIIHKSNIKRKVVCLYIDEGKLLFVFLNDVIIKD